MQKTETPYELSKKQIKHDPLKRIIFVASSAILLLLLWQVFTSYTLHKRYQETLTEAVADKVITEYQGYIHQLRLEMDLFQNRESEALFTLYSQGKESQKEAYLSVLEKLRAEMKHVRLFSVVNEKGDAYFSHITGDFMPSCKEEVADTLRNGKQERLFLHQGKNSSHFDLLQPVRFATTESEFFFVAFDVDVLKRSLERAQLPHQELFLLRQDKQGHVELTSVSDIDTSRELSQSEIDQFETVKPIPMTRWQIAVRLDAAYNERLWRDNLTSAVITWLLLTLLMAGFYLLQRSRTERFSQIAEMYEQNAKHDALTALVNRAYFEKALEMFLANRKDFSTGVVLQIDIDQFQLINNSYGYTFGDMLLAQFAESLTNALPAEVIVSRLGNDEFAVILPELHHADASGFIEELRRYIEDLELEQNEELITVTACIGAVNLTKQHTNCERVLLSLGQAVSTAKSKGRNRAQLYQSNDSQLQVHAQQMDVINKVEMALRQHRFVLYRQRIAPLKKNQERAAECYEVLVRMFDENGILVPPNEFIPVAEQYGMISQIDLWVIETTCQAISLEGESASTRYSINLSGKTLANPELARLIKRLFKQYEITPSRVCFEITETAAIGNFDVALAFITSMKAEGCRFYLDDFGSGMSTFAYLKKLPVDTIKIDGSLIVNLHQDEVSRALVESIQRMATVTGKTTVAEWVENAEAAELLREMGVAYAQGYYVHKPEHWYLIRAMES
ncbi:bifunctional diguanylate cyclase/phosphodiesterase [Aestuariibacter sp. AA17]|uniref:Bifunctional diguanylate cyclase/phosphodiesterase n=1 Tax=Fluctibacter corallii TaxID=2984329 RepID=A0ABT3AC69_9ALTE|nr:bifunctional diguanylate cyclase/phosphodiesterase [Aestuariibacter sp. AA17]MCV2886228.1 bifunctional diguanylate cyclase/phosphodiesterase [Aestuariibacter sp. AA17]